MYLGDTLQDLLGWAVSPSKAFRVRASHRATRNGNFRGSEGWKNSVNEGKWGKGSLGGKGVNKSAEEYGSWECSRGSRSGEFIVRRGKRDISKGCWATSLVVQQLRLCAPMQGTQVRSLVRELDPTCHN